MLRRLLHLRARDGRSRRRGEEDVLLRDVRVRDLFRNRSKDELELSEWDVDTRGSIDASPSEADSDTKRNLEGGRCVAMVRLKSLKSEVSTHITFVNTTGKEIRILWINFEGDEVAYNVILPGEKRRQQTFVTHPWIFRDLETHERLMADGRSAFCATEHREALVYIEHVPRLQWNPKAHHLYPQDFKERARTVLMCHYRLQDRGEEEGGENASSFTKYFSELPADILLKLLEHSSPRGIPDTRWIKPCLLPEKPPEDCISTYIDHGRGATSCPTSHGLMVTAR